MAARAKFIPATLLILCLLTIPAVAQKLTFSLGAGSDSLVAEALVETDFDRATAFAGGGVMYEEDCYTLYHLQAGLKESLFAPALTFGLGFKGVAGEFETRQQDFDMAALGFLLLGECDFKKTAVDAPFTLTAEIVAAPDPLSFEDATQYLEFTVGLAFNIINNGAIIVEYTRIEADFEKSGREKDMSENIIQAGFRLSLGD